MAKLICPITKQEIKYRNKTYQFLLTNVSFNIAMEALNAGDLEKSAKVFNSIVMKPFEFTGNRETNYTIFGFPYKGYFDDYYFLNKLYGKELLLANDLYFGQEYQKMMEYVGKNEPFLLKNYLYASEFFKNEKEYNSIYLTQMIVSERGYNLAVDKGKEIIKDWNDTNEINKVFNNRLYFFVEQLMSKVNKKDQKKMYEMLLEQAQFERGFLSMGLFIRPNLLN